MKHCTIPDAWTGEEALAFVALLDRLSQAIWRAHGLDMASCLHERHGGDFVRRPRWPRLVHYDNGPNFDDESLPFTVR